MSLSDRLLPDRVARMEWRYYLRRPLLLVTVAVAYGVSEWVYRTGGTWVWAALHSVSPRASHVSNMVLNPLAWVMVAFAWWLLRGEHREGRAAELATSPMSSWRLFWVKIPPLSLLLCVSTVAGSLPWILIDTIETHSQFPEFFSVRSLINHRLIRNTLHLGVMSLAAPLITAGLMVGFRGRRHSLSPVIIGALAVQLIAESGFQLGIYTMIFLDVHLDIPRPPISFLLYVHLLGALWGLLFSLLATVYVLPRFKRLYLPA